jgi:hypothetical protein
MRKRPGLLFVFTFLCCSLQAQVFPKENSSLHYVLIGFRFEAADNAQTYRLEIAKGNHNSAESFKKNVVLSKESTENKVIAQVPSFGSEYTWRVLYKKNGSFIEGKELHHFSTLTVTDVDSTKVRMRIIKAAEKYKNAFVFSDITRTLYDMAGHPIWFLPYTANLQFDGRQIRDLKITSAGTITFVAYGREAYEVDYNGNVLWKAPKKILNTEDSLDRYNHELTRLSNGHYMVLGTEFVWSDPSAPRPSKENPPLPPKPGEPRRVINHQIPFGTLMELNDKGDLIWSWRCAQYFQKSDLSGLISTVNGPVLHGQMEDVHQNSFFFDEKNQAIYLSYKNIHRIIKLKYPQGIVTNAYGETSSHGLPMGKGLYCYQHACKISQKGDLYLFNNNSCHSNHAPEILVLKEPVANGDSITIIWKYEFPVEPLADRIRKMNPTAPAYVGNGAETSGGNVIELPDESMFASLCMPYNDLFIISRNKKILWHAILERWDTEQKKWSDMTQYRASIIPNAKALENLIWNAAIQK